MPPQTYNLSAGMVPKPSANLSGGLVKKRPPVAAQPSSQQIVQQQTGIHPFTANIPGHPLLSKFVTEYGRYYAGLGRAVEGVVTAPLQVAKAAYATPKTPEEAAAQGGGGPVALALDRMIAEPAEQAAKTSSGVRDSAIRVRELAKRIDAASTNPAQLRQLQKQYPQINLSDTAHARRAAHRLTMTAINLYVQSVGDAASSIPALGPMGQQAGERMASGDVTGAVTESFANALMMGAPSVVGDTMKTGAEAVKKLPSPGDYIRSKVGPRAVPLAGEEVPSLVGEAEPGTRAGRMQTLLKRTGQKAPKFEKALAEQQVAVKNVIRNTAAETSGIIGPLSEEPGAAMTSAAETTFAKARPMYEALDNSLQTVPELFNGAGKVVADAITRARKLGLDIDPNVEESLVFDGKKITKADNPELWQRLKEQGIVNDAGEGTPLSAAVSIRSQLLKMMRGSSDAAYRANVANEVGRINAEMEKALKGSPLYDNWMEANRLWSKGYALREVADAINSSVTGTPPSVQAEGLARIPTKISASGLVERLNDLDREGVLDRAFTPEEASNLRKAADILDRAQKVPIGKSEGSFSFFKGLAAAARGSVVPAAGAALGYAMSGEIRGAEYGAGVGYIVQEVGMRSLINAMTTKAGVGLLERLSTTKNAAAAARYIQAMKVLGGQQTGENQ